MKLVAIVSFVIGLVWSEDPSCPSHSGGESCDVEESSLVQVRSIRKRDVLHFVRHLAHINEGSKVRHKVKIEEGQTKTLIVSYHGDYTGHLEDIVSRVDTEGNSTDLGMGHAVLVTVNSTGLTMLENDGQIDHISEDSAVEAAVHERHSRHSASTRAKNQEVLYGVTMVQAREVPQPPAQQAKKVCVVDTGVDADHEDLPDMDGANHNLYGSSQVWSNDGNGHGTHCAGTIGALNNNIGVEPVFDGCPLFITKGLTDSGSGFTSGVMEAVELCVENGAQVVSMSLGGASWSSASQDFYQNLYDDNVLIIAAAGNGGDSAYSYPASYPSIMSVAAVDSGSNKASFSQYNDQVEISGPGVGIMSTYTGGGYASLSGTSMATPHVAAVAGLVWSHFPDCTNSQIRSVLLHTATATNSGGVCDNEYGFGIVNAKAAYDMLANANGDCTVGGAASVTPVGGCNQPVAAPAPEPTPSPLPTAPAPNPTPAPTTSGCNGVVLEVTLTTDRYASETSWVLSGGGTRRTGSGYSDSTEYAGDFCLDYNTDYTWIMKDSYGDGICCAYGEGSYTLTWGGTLVRTGGEFARREITNLQAISSR